MKSLIPLPNKYEVLDGFFEIDSATCIYIDDTDAQAVTIGYMLANALGVVRDAVSVLENKVCDNIPRRNAILLSLNKSDKNSCVEGYKLSVQPTYIHIIGDGYPGMFYAVQTLLQLTSNVSGKEKNGSGGMRPVAKLKMCRVSVGAE
jgi:hypothetical protein